MTMREITRQFPSKSVLEIWRLTWNNFMWAAICSCREVFLDTLLVQPVAQHHHKMIFDDLNVHILLAYNSRTFKECISYFAGSECFLMPRFLYHWYGGCPTEAGQMKATANSEFVLLERGPLYISKLHRKLEHSYLAGFGSFWSRNLGGNLGALHIETNTWSKGQKFERAEVAALMWFFWDHSSISVKTKPDFGTVTLQLNVGWSKLNRSWIKNFSPQNM